MVNCFEVVPIDSKQVLDRTGNRRKRWVCAIDLNFAVAALVHEDHQNDVLTTK